jgi:hypothetical protein
VLDFIGQHRREFRFDVRYRALTGASRRALLDDLEHGFPFLPSGSQLVLDRVARTIVLENVRQQLKPGVRALVDDLRSHGDRPLAEFLRESGRELADVYAQRRSLTGLRREAGLPTPPAGPDEKWLLGRMSAFARVDDPERAEVYARLADPAGPVHGELTDREQRLARMLFFLLWPDRGGHTSYAEGLAALRRHPAVCAEIRELVALGVDTSRHVPEPLGAGLLDVPLHSHAHYRREEILAALGWASMARKAHGHASGVAWADATRTDALLVNLRKTERDFSPTTMYRDFALSPDLFHWESQNATTLASASGQRYIHHRERGTHVALFVRETKTDDLGEGAPFLLLGECDHVEHRGERPIAITWRLRRPMPAETFLTARVVAS